MNKALLIGVLILLGVGALLFRKRRSYYPFKVKSDYIYNLPVNEVVRLKEGVLTLPSYLDDSYTIFAKVGVKSTFLGNFAHPYLVVKSDRGVFKQYAEYGSEGIRYLNLSNLFGANKQLKISGKRLKALDGEVELSFYKNPSLVDKKLLIIAPHPDDAEIAAYGLYEKYAKNTFILTLSAGEGGYFTYKELYPKHEVAKHHRKKGDLRTWNSLTVPLLAGVDPNHLLNLGYFNDTLEEMFLNKGKEIGSGKMPTSDVSLFRKHNTNPLVHDMVDGSNWEAVVENIKRVIEHVQPDLILTAHPYIDSHEDHQYATLATIEALEKLGREEGEFLFYTNHYKDAEYYPYGRMGSIMTLPPKFDASIYCEGFFSFPLGEEEQLNKIFAFDGMNDLRSTTSYRLWNRLLANGFTRLREKYLSIEKDYFNRYVRSNELFFRLPVKELVNKEENKKKLWNGTK